MGFFIGFIALAFGLFWESWAVVNAVTPEVARQRAPEFELLDLQGRKIRSTDFAGKVRIVDFWAT